MEFLNKLLNRKHELSIEELFYLNELLKSDLPIKTCLNLIENTSNKAILESLVNRLDKGRLIEKIIIDYLPNEIALLMNDLLKSLSFKESLSLALAFYAKSKENAKALTKVVAYPLVLLFISLTGLYLFDSYGLNSILNLMRSFDVDIRVFSFIRVIIKIIIYIFYFGFIVVACFLLYFTKPKHIVLFYVLLSKYYPNSLLHTYCTEEFASLFVITLKLGYKTKDALTILKSIKAKPLVSFMAFHLDDKLLEGKSLKEASKQIYFDVALAKYINIASYTTNFVGVIENYVNLASDKLKNKMKLYANILQFVSYAMIGLIIVFIYQVLFLPMKMITNFN